MYLSPSVIPSGTTFQQFQGGGPSAHLERLIAANLNGTTAPTVAPTVTTTGGGQTITSPAAAITATANGGGRTLTKPSVQATVSATGGASTGGSFPAGTFYVGYTFVTASGGETTLGSSQSTVLTVSAGNIPTATLPALQTGATSMNVYIGTVSGTLYLYKRGITGVTVLLDTPLWFGGVAMASAPSPPTVNTTVGPMQAGVYYIAETQYHATGETTVGSSVLASALTVTANAAPTGNPTGAGSGSSGFLPAAATGYLYQVTYVDQYGNETTGLENSAATALTAGQTLTVTFHDTAPDWVAFRNLYLTAANGTTGTETLYATGISPTASTYACSSASWLNGTIPQASARALLTAGTSAAQVPSLTLPGDSSGATGQRIYVSANGGTNAALALYATNVQGTTYYMTAPWNAALFAAAVAPPVTNTTAGLLAAGAYYLRITETNGLGETTVSPESLTFTTSAGNIPQVTFPTLQAGNTARNVYVTPVGGATGTEVLYADGIAAGTYNLAYAAPSAGPAAPTVAPTIATGTTYGGSLAAGTYYLKSTEFSGGVQSLAGPESNQFTVSAQSAPSGTPTVNVTGSGGTLIAATYFGKFTYVDASNGGETLAGNEFTFTQTGTNEPVITISDGGLPAWASGRKLYLTQPGGASGTETFAFGGITGTTYTITANPPNSSVAPPAVNTSSTNQPVVTFPTIQPGNALRSVFLTAANGASGTEVLYAFQVATPTLTLSVAAANPASTVTPPTVAEVSALAVAPPTSNTTGLTSSKLQLLRYAKTGQFEKAWTFLHQVVSVFNQGEPASSRDILMKYRDVAAIFAMINQVCNEGGSLIDGNPGRLANVKLTGGMNATRRVWS